MTQQGSEANMQCSAQARAGGQGTVTVSTWNGKPAAYKTVPRSSPRTVAAEDKMATMPETHPHITRVLARGRAANDDYLQVQELALCDMLDALQRTPSRCTYELGYAREWLLQIAHALDFCHERAIAHRDVKPENILLFSPDNLVHGPCDAPSYNKHQANLLQLAAQAAPQSSGASSMHKMGFMAKVTDWGSAFYSTVADMNAGKARGRSARGSTLYSCPEVQLIHVLSTSPEKSPAGVPRTDLWPTEATTAQAVAQAQEGYSPYAADVWSFGITVYAMVLGRAPFSVASPASKAFRAFVRATQPRVLEDIAMAPCYAAWGADVGADGQLPQWHWPSSFSPALVDLLSKCLQVREADRATMADIKSHPWFTTPKWVPASMPAGMKAAVVAPRQHSAAVRGRDNSDGRSASTGALSRGHSESRHGSGACATPGQEQGELHSRSDLAAWDQAVHDGAAAQGSNCTAGQPHRVTDNTAGVMHARQASVPHSDSDTDEDGDRVLADGTDTTTIQETTGSPQATSPKGTSTEDSEVQHRSKLPRKLGAEPMTGTPAAVHTGRSTAKVAPQAAVGSPAQAAAAAASSQKTSLAGKCFGAA